MRPGPDFPDPDSGDLEKSRRSARSGPSRAPDAQLRTTGDEVEPTSLGGENQRRPSLPMVDVHDFDA
jgi:hypothetical protein